MNLKPTTPVQSLCRKWWQTHHKQTYECSLAKEEDASDRIVDATEEAKRRLEAKIAEAQFENIDDADAALRIASWFFEDYGGDFERVAPLISATRRGLSRLRDGYERRAA